MPDVNVSFKGNPHSRTEQLNESLCGLFIISPHDVPVTEQIKTN